MAELYQTNCTTIEEALASKDWRDRLIGEYNFVQQKEEKLYSVVIDYECGRLNFSLSCNPKLLKAQLNAMSTYSYILALRMELEHINPDLKQPNVKQEVTEEEEDEEEPNIFNQMIKSMESLVSSLHEEMEKDETKHKNEEKKVVFTSVTCPNPNCDIAMETTKPDVLTYCPSCGTKLEKAVIKDA